MQMEKEQTNVNQLYEDYGSNIPSTFSPQRSSSSGSAYQQPQYSPPGLSSMPMPMPTPSYSMPLASAPAVPSLPPATPSISSEKSSSSNELDLNDPSTLEIYSRILLFKDDRMRDELAFSRTLTPKQRRVVHLIAQKLGVYHYSVGEGDERYAVVTRIDPQRVSDGTNNLVAKILILSVLATATATTTPTATTHPFPGTVCLSLAHYSVDDC